jgi:murein DD-endopeptidase MepM/ murein hydrolase activator NlpD
MSSARENLLSLILWIVAGVMIILLVALVVFFKPKFSLAAPTATPASPTQVEPTISATQEQQVIQASYQSTKKVVRALNPHTDISTTERTQAIEYTVAEGDSLFNIAKQYNLKPESVFWANYDKLGGSPDMITPGITLIIPPSDGVYYKWKQGDTFQSIADEFYAKTQDILEAPVNKLDLTNPTMTSGSYVMVPGGKREAVTWFQGAIPRGSAGTLSHLLGSGGCDTTTAGAVGDGVFGMPIPGGYVVGNDYIEGVHQGIDLGSASSNSILAADDGVVVYAGWANGGYGNTVMIDHGNGYQTLYAHMSTVLVSCGQSVGQGSQIGVVGSTGNSTGPHCHFEIRYMGLNVNPHDFGV